MRDQVVRGDEYPSLGVPEERVRRGVARTVLNLELAVSELEDLTVVKRLRDARVRAPRAEASRDGAQGDDHILRDPVATHDVGREGVVPLGVVGKVLEERDG